MLARLLDLVRIGPPGHLSELVAAAIDLPVERVELYVVDYDSSVLQSVDDSTTALSPALALQIPTSLAGRAFTTQEVTPEDIGGGTHRRWVPVTERDNRMGVLCIDLTDDLVHLDPELPALGMLAGQLLTTSSNYTDRYEMRRRRTNMNLAAEMQWRLLPPLSFRAPGVEIHGALEPAYEIGGDVFDYALNGPVMEVGIFDAMGHGLEAAESAAAALGAYRYCRRRGLHITEIATTIDVAIQHLYGGDRFVTGQLLQLDLLSGLVQWVDAGHPNPYWLRGSTVIDEPMVEPCVPFGLGSKVAEVGELHLEPGDHLLLLSDGSIEARPEAGDQFGRHGVRSTLDTAFADGCAGQELLRRIVQTVISHRAGELEDDVTFALLSRTEPDPGPDPGPNGA